jgi:hypothetical protein
MHDDDTIYYFAYLPINFDTSHVMTPVLTVNAMLAIEFDRQRVADFFKNLSPKFSEEERFSPTVFNLKHLVVSTDIIKSSFKVELKNLELMEPYRFELSITTNSSTAFMTYHIENAIRTKDVTFEIIDSDVLIEEPYEIVNGAFIKPENKLISYIDYLIFNKNVL